MSRIAFLTCIIFLGMASFAQRPCGITDTLKVPGAIFGPDELIATGTATITTPRGLTLTYSCVQAQIVCTNAAGRQLWTADVSDRLIYFRLLQNYLGPLQNKKIKGCDVIFQYHDKQVFVLKSKSGRVKEISDSNIFSDRPKARSRKDKK